VKALSVKSGVLIALAGYAVYAWGDGFIKSLAGQISVFELGFFNSLFAGFFLYFLRPGAESWSGFWRTSRPWAVHMRGALGLLAGVCSIYAFTTIPLADVYALLFLAPLFVTLMSIIFLKEQVGPWRWAAVIAGFLGVLLVVKPGVRELELGHLAATAAALAAAASLVLMRSLANERQTTVIGVLIAYMLIFNAVAAMLTGVSMPNWQVLVVLVLTGLCTAGGQRLQLLAIRLAPANLIAPTHYSQMIWAVLIGALFFAEYPDGVALFGLAVIAAAGLLTIVRENIRLGSVRWNPFRTRL